MFSNQTAWMTVVLSKAFAGILIFFVGNLVVPSKTMVLLSAQNSSAESPEKEQIQLEREAERAAAVWNEDSYRRARSLYQELARKTLSDRNVPKYASCLREAARLSLSLNEPDLASQLLSGSLSAERKTGNMAGESETLSALTLTALRKNDLVSGERFQREALLLAEKSKQPIAIAKALFASAAYSYRNQRNLPLMLKMQERSLYLFRLAGDRTGEMQVLTELAYTYVMNSDRLKGQAYATEAVQIGRATGDARNLAFALIALGDATQRVGNWQEAYRTFKEAESLFPENVDYYERAILSVRFGFHYEVFGDLIEARGYFEKARDLFIKTGNLYGNSELATRIGQISMQLGDEAKALTSIDEGLRIGLQSKDRYSIAYAYENFGGLYLRRNEFKPALDYYRRALRNFNAVGIKHSVASVNEEIGRLYFLSGDDRRAEKFYQAALDINLRIRSRAGQASSLCKLAEVHARERNLENGLNETKECISLTDSLSVETANQKLRQSFLADVFDRYELYIGLLMGIAQRSTEEKYSIEALQATEKSRARSMLENLSLAEIGFTKDADQETLKRQKEIRVLLNAKADKLTDLLSSGGVIGETEKITGEINELQNEFENTRAGLKESSPQYSAIQNPPPFDIAGFRDSVLDDDTILLEFSFGKDESYLWLLGKSSFSSYVLPGRVALESRIERLRELVGSREMKEGETVEEYQLRMSEADKTYWQEAHLLSNDLLGQISSELKAKRLIIVPDGKLRYFPVSALPLPNSSVSEPILLTNETIYEPSASTLLLLRESRKEKTADTKDLLVFSDPVFSATDPRISGHDTLTAGLTATNFRFAESLDSLPRLAASKTEGESIANIVGVSRSQVLSGFSATRERVLRPEISDYRVIHFATHGWIDEERPGLSGIIMSRFDENGRQLDEFVRLQDIYGLRLSADLVVLSACKTGVGKELKGEGLISLTNGFMQSGAGSVLSSLWKVDDAATLKLMTDFYAPLVDENISASAALRKAQIKMWSDPQYHSPFYWAAFTIQGDYRPIPQLSQRSPGNASLWILAGLVIVLSALGLYRRHRKLSQVANAH